jgi:hypothetical protein
LFALLTLSSADIHILITCRALSANRPSDYSRWCLVDLLRAIAAAQLVLQGIAKILVRQMALSFAEGRL